MRETLKRVALGLTSVMVACLIMEVIVRVLDVAPRPLAPLPIPSYRLSDNPVISYEYRPGYQPMDQPFDASHTGYDINSAGFRDHEYEETKPAGTFRIVVLGDSTSAGNGVADLDRTYTKLLEQALNRDSNTGIRYEVLNMAVGGYHTLQEVETLRVKGLRYDPDLVLVTFCMNDFELHSDGGVYEKLHRKNRPLVGDSEMPSARSLLRFSRLALIIQYRFHSSQSQHDRWYARDVLKGQSPVKAGFTLLSELQQQHGFPVLVVILPEFKRPFDQYRSLAIHQKVIEAARGLPGIRVIDLLEKFANLDNDASKFSYDDSLHMNEAGHRAMAEILLPILYTAALRAVDTERPSR